MDWRSMIGEPDERGCRRWVGTWLVGGRPQVRVDGKNQYVARILLSESLGRPIRSGYYALHTCDVGTCCEVSHLFEGTPRRNILDAVEKGRWTQAGYHPRIEPDQARWIREQYASGNRWWTRRRLADRFAVSENTITEIVRGHRFRTAGGPISGPRGAGGRPVSPAGDLAASPSR